MGVINLGAIVEKLRKKLSGDGFVTTTDYATTSTGGVIKTSSTYATDITSGSLKAKEITAANYASANNAAFISKKTLDNLINAGTLGGGGNFSGTEQKVGTWFGDDLYQITLSRTGAGTFSAALPANCPNVMFDLGHSAYKLGSGNWNSINWYASDEYVRAYYAYSSGDIVVQAPSGLSECQMVITVLYTKPTTP